MKNQYFGDIIDLFKYDLLKALSEDIQFREILFIPLLTKNDKSNDGKKRNYQNKVGSKNQKLISFFEEKYSEDKHERKAKVIEEYYKDININFRFNPEEIFIHKNRNEYFSSLISSLKTSSIKNQLLFFDPDNGMQVKRSKDKHILYQELKNTLNNLCDDSVISVIQFRPRIKWETVLENKKQALIKEVSPFITYIADKNIAFYLMTKSQKRLKEVESSLEKYKQQYSFLV